MSSYAPRHATPTRHRMFAHLVACLGGPAPPAPPRHAAVSADPAAAPPRLLTLDQLKQVRVMGRVRRLLARASVMCGAVRACV
jgi:hypothetical protein